MKPIAPSEIKSIKIGDIFIAYSTKDRTNTWIAIVINKTFVYNNLHSKSWSISNEYKPLDGNSFLDDDKIYLF